MNKRKVLRIAVVALLCCNLPAYAIRPVYTEQQKQAAKMKEGPAKTGVRQYTGCSSYAPRQDGGRQAGQHEQWRIRHH